MSEWKEASNRRRNARQAPQHPEGTDKRRSRRTKPGCQGKPKDGVHDWVIDDEYTFKMPLRLNRSYAVRYVSKKCRKCGQRSRKYIDVTQQTSN